MSDGGVVVQFEDIIFVDEKMCIKQQHIMLMTCVCVCVCRSIVARGYSSRGHCREHWHRTGTHVQCPGLQVHHLHAQHTVTGKLDFIKRRSNIWF